MAISALGGSFRIQRLNGYDMEQVALDKTVRDFIIARGEPMSTERRVAQAKS